MDLDRRGFVTWSFGAAFALALAPAKGAPAAAGATLSPWITIGADGKVTLVSTVSEMGQGARTGQVQVLADELDVPWGAITVRMAADAEPFRRGGRLTTGGSASLRTRFHLLRRAGATARAQLIDAAARRWGVAAGECAASLGEIIHAPSGRRCRYGEVAAAAAAADPPANPPLKEQPQWRYIGKSLPTLELIDKTSGKAGYGIDVRLPGMAIASIRQCPIYGGALEGVEPAPALALAGVRRVVRLKSAVAVVADDTWTAFQGVRRLQPHWSLPSERLTSSGLAALLEAALDAPEAKVSASGEGDAAAIRARLRARYAAATRKLEATYEVPYLAHAPLEPMNATAWVTPQKIRIWAPTQNVTALRNEVARALGRSVGEVELTVTLLGGGFGRRLKADYAVQAAQIAAAHGGPVKLVWTREEDLAHDFFRPAALNRFRAALEDDGLIAGYEVVGAATNDTADQGAGPEPYEIAAFANTQSEARAGVPVGAWRSVDNSITTFGRESFIDEAAHAAGRDPLEYRRALLGHQARARQVLDTAAEAVGWDAARPRGVGVGLALFRGWGSTVCHAVEVELAGRTLKVRRIAVAADCGLAVNPDQVKAQLEGGTLMGLSAALGEAATFTDGRADLANFDGYKLLRMGQAPVVQAIVLARPGAAVGGAGEPPVPGVAPALANAIFAATGERVRTLPIAAAGFHV
ncbi:MAG TPA: molybdopterin cofactor-binding domain-containing protein [Caulobacteraceae bacterium]|nr:molybdopterin cofactor-binding domain-containing protein [Caulobacteraceae bacterium]